jgi:hypothetical protein
MTSVCDVVPEPDEAVGGLLDEHAAAPAARATAAVTVTSFLGPSILVMIIFRFPVVETADTPRCGAVS